MCEYLLNPYILNIRTRIRTNHLSLFRISPKRQERLDDIYRLDKEGKSTQEITDFMNQKYQKTLFTNNPYYKELIWVTLDKYKKHKERLLDYAETIEEVYLDELIHDNTFGQSMKGCPLICILSGKNCHKHNA